MDSPLRIAIALPGMHRVVRGAETAFEQIARELARLGHQVTVFGSGHGNGDLPYRYHQISCIPRENFEAWPKLPCLRSHYAWEEMTFAPGLLRQFDPHQFDITLACSYPYMNWILRRRHNGRPLHVFVTQNGDWMAQARNAEYRFFGCDGLVCTNSQYFQRHQDRYPSALIPNGVDPAIFSPGPADRAAYGLPENARIALMVSALIPSKRVIEGVRAAAKIPDLFLAVAGDGESRHEVQAAADEYLPGRFKRLTLPREKMPGLYRCADVFLHLSRDEPSANAYMEALASGLPIVTHDWEVTRWTLENCAILVDGADESAVVAGLQRALSANSPAQVDARRALVDRRFAWSSIAQDYTQFFRRLLNANVGAIARGISPSPGTQGEGGGALGIASNLQSEINLTPTLSRNTGQGGQATSESLHDNGKLAEAEMLSDVGLVAIGRNEGDRLKRCLASVVGKVAAIVYVDSGSTDGSVAVAKEFGVDVVELDMSKPFNAARARNTGLQRLLEIAANISADISLVQFVDGDCEVRPGWLSLARGQLLANADIAVVCGRRRERFPGQSIYNQLIDWEWNTAAGQAKSCGGDAMMKIPAVLAAGSFNPSVMAGEEPELCLRLRNAGHKVFRLDAEMTLHDVAMTHFSQWWKRHIRAGYAAIDVWTRFGKADGLNASQVRSARVWAIAWPTAVVLAAIAGAVTGWIFKKPIPAMSIGFAIIVLLAWPAQVVKLAARSVAKGRPIGASFSWAWLIMVAKFAAVVGQWKWRNDFRAGRIARLIEYK